MNGQDDLEAVKELSHLQDSYEAKYGFKFIVFVNKQSRRQLLPAILERMKNDREKEIKTGLEAMVLIAKDRYQKKKSNL